MKLRFDEKHNLGAAFIMMTEIYRVSEKHADDLCTIEDSPHVSGADGDTATVPEGRAEKKFNLWMVLLIFSLLLVAAPIFFSIYYFIKLNHKEQELEELRIANYNLTSNNSALQSQYVTLNKKHEELANKFSKLQEYYCDVTNTSHENTCPLCKMGWIHFVSKCYFISTKTLTWNESRDWCLTKGGQLVNIENLEEWGFLQSKAFIIGAEERHYWIGRYDMIEEEKTTRMDSEPVQSNRATDDYKGKCLVIWPKWNQDFRVRCESLNQWICEFAAFPLRI